MIGLVVGGAILGASIFVGAFVTWRGGSVEAPPVLARAAMPVALAEPSSVRGESKPPRESVAARETRDVSSVDERSSDESSMREVERGEGDEGATSELDRSSRTRPAERASATSVAGVCEDTCRWARDGECDDGRPGATTACSAGTDCADCGPWQGALPRRAAPANGTAPSGTAPGGLAPGHPAPPLSLQPLGVRRTDCAATTYGAFEASPFGSVVVRRRLADRFPGACLASVGAAEALMTLTTDAAGAIIDVRVSPNDPVMRTCLQNRLFGLRFDPAAAGTIRVPILCR